MIEERAAAFAKRSIKTSAKLAGLKIAISMMDLTTLEGKDTPGKIAFLCRKAMQPLDPRYQVPPCAAVCVYPTLVRVAKKFLGESGVTEQPPAQAVDAPRVSLVELVEGALPVAAPNCPEEARLLGGDLGVSNRWGCGPCFAQRAFPARPATQAKCHGGHIHGALRNGRPRRFTFAQIEPSARVRP